MHSVVAAICNLQSKMLDAVKDAFAVDDMNFVYFLKFLLCGCALLDVWLCSLIDYLIAALFSDELCASLS